MSDELEMLRLEVANNKCTVKTATVLNVLIEKYKNAKKDIERWNYLKDKYAMVNFDIYDAEIGETKVAGIIFEMPSGIRYSADIVATIDQAIDKERNNHEHI